MNGMSGMPLADGLSGLSYGEWLSQNQDDVILKVQQHALLAIYAILLAAVLGVLLAVLTYRNRSISATTISVSAAGFTIPSVALFGFLLALFGGNPYTAIYPALVLYALLPILRNGIVGLQSVDPAVLDAAKGMGVGRFRMLWQIEMPIAWPILLAGIRVSAQLTVGITAIAAFVAQVGLGTYAYSALINLGSVNTDNEAITSVIFVVAIALVFDAVFVVVRRITTPRGLRV